jgi:hypothetical protein
MPVMAGVENCFASSPAMVDRVQVASVFFTESRVPAAGPTGDTEKARAANAAHPATCDVTRMLTPRTEPQIHSVIIAPWDACFAESSGRAFGFHE